MAIYKSKFFIFPKYMAYEYVFFKVEFDIFLFYRLYDYHIFFKGEGKKAFKYSLFY